MDQEKQRLNLSHLLNSLPKSYHTFSDEQETVSSCGQLDNILASIIADDKTKFIRHFELFRLETQCGSSSPERKTVLNLLHLCCMFDSVECAAALLNGEVGVVPLVNETDVRGRAALHTAAEVHARRCIELLLKKHARTDLRTRDGRRLLALDLSLCSSRMDVVWNPDEHSVEDLVVCLGQKDLTAVRLLSDKTKEITDVAYAHGIEGQVVSFAALLMVAEEKVKGSIMVLHDAESGGKEKTTIYESLIREALALGREDTTSIRIAKRTCNPTKAECIEKRKLLLCEIELLQLSGSMSPCGCIDRKVTSPLILATQAGDETVIQLLLKTNLEINDADAEGNSSLHWCFKTSKISSQKQMKILHLLLKCGAQRCSSSSHEDDSLHELGDLNLSDEGTPVERGAENCFAYDEEEFQQIQKGVSITLLPLERKIFVRGLPPTMDSDSLRGIFEEQFGPVEVAVVIEYEKENEARSRGFGFIVFKHEGSISAALQVRHVTICGKQVEINSAIHYPKCLLPSDFTESTPRDEQELDDRARHQAAASDALEVDEPKAEQMTWVDRLLKGQQKVYYNDSQPPTSTCSRDQSIPPWLRIFKKWLPGFLQDLSRKGNDEHYALSSLKGDFRAKFGMELDHASLGFMKLSEFMRSFPKLCRLKVVPVGSSGHSNHMVLVPNLLTPHQQPSRALTITNTPSSANSVETSGLTFSSETESPVSCITEDTNMQDLTTGNSSEKHKDHCLKSRSLVFKPYELFGPRNSRVIDDEGVELEGNTLLHLEKHPVLEALPRRNRKYSFFLRDIDFYMDYMDSVSKGCCFACKQHKMTCSNFPCRHWLWCSNCKLEAMKAAGSSKHKCAICDIEVQRIDPIPWTESSQPTYRDIFSKMASTF